MLTAGQIAKYSHTTKRTIQWYDRQNLLKPASISEAGYRLYKPEQVIDFQTIRLFRKLNFSLTEIKTLVHNNKSVREAFKLKRIGIKAQINLLNKALKEINNYYKNLEISGNFLSPIVKQSPTLTYYYIERNGPYSKIIDYFLELDSCFEKITKESTFLVTYNETMFNPKNAQMQIGVITNRKILPKKNSELLTQKLPSYKALSYTHKGSSDLLAFIWEELIKYFKKNGYKGDKKFPSLIEFSHYTKHDYIYELQIPISRAS